MKNWNKYLESLIIPGVKIDNFLTGIEIASDNYKNILSNYYNTLPEYIDIDDKDKHIFKVNDIKGNILKNNRVVFTVMIFTTNDLENTIKENIVLSALQEFYSNLPNMVNIYGINIKPLSFINKDELKYTINNSLTINEIIRIFNQLSDYKYDGNIDGYHIWSKL
jgi:hypothetical protein